MFRLWGRPVSTVALISAAALVVWPIFGAIDALLVYCALLLALLVHHIANLSALQRWLKEPRPESIPDGRGVWEEVFAGLVRMVKKQTQIESRLSAALDRFQQAARALPEGVVLLDRADGIEWCNPRAEALFGLDVERDRGQPVTYLIRRPRFAEYLASHNFAEPLVLKVAREGQEAILSLQLVPYGDEQKLLLCRDITHWERLETMRRDFVANVSHELRTPLTVVGGFLETLTELRRSDPEMTRRSLQLMTQQTHRMQRLVEDLLTLSRLESTANPLREERVDVPAMVRGLQQDATALSAGRHRLTLHVATDAGLIGSAEELRSAFGNLISNAIRYTPDGGEIEVRWESRGDDLTFSVRDSGIGIEPQHIPRLTERFYRVDRSRSRETGGTGLGLAIVKHVLSRHQGVLEIDSEPGRGSRFTAVFPPGRRVAASFAAEPQPEPIAGSA